MLTYCAPWPENMNATARSRGVPAEPIMREPSEAASAATRSSASGVDDGAAMLHRPPSDLQGVGDVRGVHAGRHRQLLGERRGHGLQAPTGSAPTERAGGVGADRRRPRRPAPPRARGARSCRRCRSRSRRPGADPVSYAHGMSSRLTKNGLFAKSIAGLSVSQLRLGGISRCSSARTVLIRLATPAAGSRCPTFVLTEPTAQKPVPRGRGAERLRQRADLDRVADRRAGPVRLDVRDVSARTPACAWARRSRRPARRGSERRSCPSRRRRC